MPIKNIVEDLRRRSVSIYLAAETREAETDSKKFREAADEIERLRAETGVLFWLIIAMNTAVIIIFIELSKKYCIRRKLVSVNSDLLTGRANVPSCPIIQEIATIPQDAASLHGHVPGNLFYPRLVVSDANDRAARLAAIPAGESPANRGVQTLL